MNQQLEEIKSKYKLTNEQFEEMYANCKYITFYNCKSQEKPTAIFVGGQTGAGKGGIDIFSKNELKEKDQNVAILDVDIYRALHPFTKEILKKYPLLYTEITGMVTGKILKRIMEEAITKKYNFIFEGTLRNTEALETMKKMPSIYKKIVRVMATSNIESLLTAFERNYQQIQISGYGRFTNVETHNITYEGVFNTIKAIENSNEDIIIEIFKRGKDITSPIKIFSTETSENLASDILTKERERDKKSFILEREKRLESLLLILKPDNEFEETQVNKLKEQINWSREDGEI